MSAAVMQMLISAGGLDADAVDWQSRVVTAGGTASASMVSAVSNFAKACKSASIWTKLNRVNLFAGDQLTAALVPLKVGSGSSTETNVNFVSGDYTTTTGITGNGSSKYINTGLLSNAFSQNNTAAGFYLTTGRTGSAAFSCFMGVGNGAGNGRQFIKNNTADEIAGGQGGVVIATGQAITTMVGLVSSSNVSSTTQNVYIDGTSVATGTITNSGSAHAYFVFAISSAGSPLLYNNSSMSGYFIASEGLTGADVSALSSAWNTFAAAVGRPS